MKSPGLLLFSILFSISVALFPLASLAQTNAVRARVTEAVNVHNLVTLRGNVHPLARPEFDQGVAPDDLPMERMLLVLQRGADQEIALRKLLDDQQTKSSAQFHQWLTPEQFGQQFAPADSDVHAVTDWLASQGFQVNRVAAGRTVIEFSGSAGLVRQVLGAEIHKFHVNGEDRWANTTDPQIPAALAPVVAGFASLNNFPRKPMNKSLGTFRRSKVTGKVEPLFTFPVTCSGGNSGCYWLALGPTDFATIYNVLPLWNAATPIDGTGQAIAVVGETNINPQDVADFRSMFGLPANPPNIILNGPDPGILSGGEESEADLDVQWSGGVARGATIDFVVSESTETTAGVDLSALNIIDNDLAPIMSESYGECEAGLGTGGNQFHNTLWEQAAAQGITVLLAAGDSGSAGCDSANAGETFAQYGLAVSGLASTPFNVAVGGTDFNDASSIATYWNQTNVSPSESSAKSYIPESTWNDSCAASGLLGCTPPPSSTYLSDGLYLLAGGGGPSTCTNPSGTFPTITCTGGYSKPNWQAGTGVPQDSARDIPDLSLFAGNGLNGSFYVICQIDANSDDDGSWTSCDLNAPYTDFQAGSGTSASVQVFAGIMAMVVQAHGRQGNANYVLYPMAAQSGASCNSSTAPVTNSTCIFYDITVGNNSVICEGGSPNCSSTTSGQYGVMANGSDSIAYPATGGYDLATGLGSVNVANLVNKWKSNFTPSSTTLSLSTNPTTNPITLTHGQPVDFTVNVTSGSGTPAGDVSLIAETGSSAGSATFVGPFTLSGGSVSNSTIMLPGGSYNVTAHYAGNGTYSASNASPGTPVTVNKESSQTELRLVTFSATAPPAYNVTSMPYGSPYFLRMDVTNGSGQLCAAANSTGYQYLPSYPCPTGSVTVSPAPTDVNAPPGTVAGSYVLNSQGYAEDQPIVQPAGVYNFVASYAGDNSYTPSASPSVPITITKAPTTLSSSSVLSPQVVESNISSTLILYTQSNGAGPTGTVQMLNDGVPVGSPINVNGVAYPNITGSGTGVYAFWEGSAYATLSTVGTWSITFQYSGDANYAGSTSSPIIVNVTDFSVSANPTSITIPAPGQSGNSILTITPLSGFNQGVGLTVSGCPTGATCTISPPSVWFANGTPLTATLSVVTTNGSQTFRAPEPEVPPSLRPHPVWPWWLTALLGLATLLAWAARQKHASGWLFVTALVLVGVWVACGGGGSVGSGGGSGGGSKSPAPTPLPAVSLQPISLTFGTQITNTTSPAQSVALTNDGTAPLAISDITFQGTNLYEYAQTNNCGTSVAAGANCTINVTFTPSQGGVRTAALWITDNAAGSPQVVNITGTGAGPVISFSPAALTFGPQAVGTASSPQTVTLSNTGQGSLGGINISTGNGFAETTTCGNSLAAGAQCGISVTFAPIIVGPVSSAVGVLDSLGPQQILLAGTGTPSSTPAGTYSVQVTGGDGNDIHAITIQVTVQ
jgi:hypothetical protein